MGDKPMNPPTAFRLNDGSSPYRDVIEILDLDFTSIISVERSNPPRIRNFLAANRKHDFKC